MPELPKKKVGIVACSGEEMAEGTVTRLAALKVLEQLRPADTVTICLPLFLAGGEGDRAFARFYPTIAIDGCDKRCAAHGTEMYSGKPAASIVLTDLLADCGLGKLENPRELNAAGLQAVEVTAQTIAATVDDLLGRLWDRRAGEFAKDAPNAESQEPVQATCSCGSGIPIQQVSLNGRTETMIALPLIFQQFREAGKMPSSETVVEMLETVKIYNPIPDGEDDAYATMLLREYSVFCEKQKATA